MLKYLLILYKKISVYFKRPCCRYYPSCSDYAIQAIDKYGSLRGLFLALKRLLLCNQFFPGGYDPVK